MINGNPNEFIDRIYTCQDTVFVYRGVKYWFQGYMPDDSTVHMEVFQVDPEKDGYIWEYDGKTIEECHEAFHAKRYLSIREPKLSFSTER